MDLEALYPSLKSQETADLLKDVIIQSNISVTDVNYRELGIFLRKNMSNKDIECSMFKEFIPMRKKKTRKTKENHEFDLWTFNTSVPSVIIVKNMFAESISIATKLMMNNHVYEFDGELLVQQGNGSIGVEFTGIAGEIYMLVWCLKLKNKLSHLRIENRMQPRMVDDITLLPCILKPGSRFENNQIVIHGDKVEEDKMIPSDVRTMNIIKQVANSIDKHIQVTYDVPSYHDDGYVPILDVKVKLNSNGKLEHIFYKKPMANRLTTLKSSAYSMKNKMTILTQECFRRLHNTSEFVSNETKANILNEFMIDLKLSGYNEQDRKNILRGGINTYSKLKIKETEGKRSFYRSYNEQKSESKDDKAKNWFKKGKNGSNFKSVMFVEATPGDKLLKMLQETESKFRISDNFRIKFVSKAGVKLKNVLVRKSTKEVPCSDNDGKPCVISDGQDISTQQCRKNRINYFAKCKTCDLQGKQRVYYGETARNIHSRSKEHYSALKNECRNSFMYKHIMKEHKDQQHEVQFEWGINGKFVKPLERQLNEALCIEKTSMKESLNSKHEYFHHNVRKIGLSSVEQTQQCEYCSRKFQSISELENHEKHFHIRYKCQECDYMSFGMIDLKDHTEIVHC